RDDRYNFATSPRHLRNVALVENKLILGKGYMELGDYDRAERAYNEALNADPFSTAARRGLEQVERYRMNYFDAAYNHTRTKRLAEVKAGWETPVQRMLLDNVPINMDGVTDGGAVSIERKLRQIVIPTMEFRDARLLDVVEFLGQKSQELDSSETDPTQRGVNIVIDSSGMPAGEDVGQRQLSVKLSNVPLGTALKYVVEQVGMSYRTDNFAVSIVSPNASQDGGLAVRNWIVPPGFISGAGGDGGADATAAAADPFGKASASTGAALVKRITAEEFLRARGVQFEGGASANYLSASSTLVVRNTADQLLLIDDIVATAKDSAPKNVQISVKIVSVETVELKQLGLDFLLGQSNLGSSPRTFFGGGTSGNSGAGVSAADFPFSGPGGPVGTFPVTSGLRSGDIAHGRTIDDVINRDNPQPSGSRAPGVLSLAGVFTDPQFQLVLRALNQMKGSDLLLDAHVTTRPGQLAKMNQVREFIYPTEYDPPEIPNDFGRVPLGNNTFLIIDTDPIFPVTPATPTAFETRNLGYSIEVEPTVGADNKTITLNVLADFADFSGFINYGTPITNSAFLVNGKAMVLTPNEILMPVFDAIKETTNITIWDGQTIAIGGYRGETVTSTKDKIPFLGDLPVLGRAFRSSTSQSTKRALTIFVTVNLVDPGGNPLNRTVEEERPEFVTRRDVAPPATFAPGPPPVYPAK
ncbi:MAG TPA: type II and III secretion system protein, partial [Bacteroidia bacterium]|nr:type II and III secretion system protein [Bacteroidia bacterium]